MAEKVASRSLVSVAVEAHVKAAKAQERADAANVELRKWVKVLNAQEAEEFASQVEALAEAHTNGGK